VGNDAARRESRTVRIWRIAVTAMLVILVVWIARLHCAVHRADQRVRRVERGIAITLEVLGGRDGQRFLAERRQAGRYNELRGAIRAWRERRR